ncbi:short transient receptor potential channel 7-like [Diadema antillarum]|uniref:short transient receptor potential channel 7-like n=1 Tax=Diadema antillarum TaxID=105358 RepID=UPI003A85ABCF
MPKGRQLRGRTLTFSAGHVLEEEDLSFFQAVSIGNLPKVREVMEGYSESEQRHLMQMTDFKDRTALEIATEVEHGEIVEYLVNNYGVMMDPVHVHECLMVAISKGYFRITMVLLDHPLMNEKEERKRKGAGTHFDIKSNSKFDRDVTPLMLAAHCNEVDIIRMLLSRGHRIADPHAILCNCTECTCARDTDPLMHSLTNLHTNRALASEAYICLTSPDPILTAFLLSHNLMRLAAREKEFKNEYRELAKQCKEFASDLLDMCQTTDEVKTILTQEATTAIESQAAEGANTLRKHKAPGKPTTEGKDKDFSLPRLDLAIKYKQKQFVAHPHCQHHLATLWYKGTPSLARQWHPLIKCVITLGLMALLPVLTLIYWTYPFGKIAEYMRSPRTKFMTHASMYVCFLLILFLESVISQDLLGPRHGPQTIEDDGRCPLLCESLQALEGSPGKFLVRQTNLSFLQWIMAIFVLGLLWGEIKQIFQEGYRNYLSSVWNWIDIAMLNLLISSLLLRGAVSAKATAAMGYFNTNGTCEALERNKTQAVNFLYWLNTDRKDWHDYDPQLIAESLFAMANILSFSRITYILPVNQFLGPLQISLMRMIGQIMRFGAVFIVVFLAFFCALTNLYWNYPDDTKFGRADRTLTTLLWALFGLAEQEDVKCSSGTTECGHTTTEIVGTALYIMYHLIMALVMLNMLIAMMTTSFQEIYDDQDVEWKFARSKLWMVYFERGATLPPPFNIIPSPKTVVHFIKFVKKQFSRSIRRSSMELRLEGNLNLNRRAGMRKQVASHESLMKKVIKRYLFKLQNEKEGEDGGEGEIEELKNDISSFRCEVMERLKQVAPGAFSDGSLSANRLQTFPSVFASTESLAGPKAQRQMSEVNARLDVLERNVQQITDSFAEFFVHANQLLRAKSDAGSGDSLQQMCNTQ